MRKIIRTSKPVVLVENGDRWNEQWKKLKTEKPSAPFNWYRHQGRSARDWIRADLAAMTQEHCAFCDRYTVEPDSVEHFRPKSDIRFLHLAYSWENLFFCCGGCQKEKGEQWDDSLINPEANDYCFSRYFMFDWSTGEMLPNPKASPNDRARAETTIRIYGLDTQTRGRFRLMALREWQRSPGMQNQDGPRGSLAPVSGC
ncbi:MAG: retron system putative HNH endonuclease [Planctomycetaceae bacterium]